ncbi:MAG: hypothetical protein SFX18_14965, partial [Pirellulales bacterium]|nr:hypothetical protein [Pirellulales bacterium]
MSRLKKNRWQARVLMSLGLFALCDSDNRLSAADLLVSDNFGSQVLLYDAATGAARGILIPTASGGLSGATGMQIRNGDLWVASQYSNQILRFDLATGAFKSSFASGGLLNGPSDLKFGPDGLLYVGNFNNGQILRYNPDTGAALGQFNQASSLSGVSYLNWGPDGQLYASSFNTNEVLKFNAASGIFSGIAASGAGLNSPSGFHFRNGELYVNSTLSHQVLRYNPLTGASLGTYITFPTTNAFPSDINFNGPGGTVLAALLGEASIVSITDNGATGTFSGTFASGQGLQTPSQILIAERPNLWQGPSGGNWSVAANWRQGIVPNNATAIAKFVDGAGSPATLDASHSVNQLVFDASSSYTLSGPAANILSLTGANPLISTSGSGLQSIRTSLNLGNNTTISVGGISLIFALSKIATSTVGSGVTVNVASNRNLTLAGVTSPLGSAAGNRAAINLLGPTSTLLVSAGNHHVGHVAGPGAGAGTALGSTTIGGELSLTVSGLRQNRLNLNAGSATTPTRLTTRTDGGAIGLIVLDNTLTNQGTGTPALSLMNDAQIDL